MSVWRYILVLVSLAGLQATVAAQGLTDPTRPPGYGGTAVAEVLPEDLVNWKVTAIRISEHDRTAIVNGILVRPGDVTGRATIREILPDQVLLAYDDRVVAVRLYEHVATRKPAGQSGAGSEKK